VNVRAVIHGIVFTQCINYNQSKNDEVASEEGGRAGAGAEGHYHGTEDTRDRVLSEMNLKQHYGTEQTVSSLRAYWYHVPLSHCLRTTKAIFGAANRLLTVAYARHLNHAALRYTATANPTSF